METQQEVIHRLGHNIILDLGALGAAFYQDLYDFFVYNRNMSKEFEPFVSTIYESCLDELIRAISDHQLDTLNRLKTIPNTELMNQVRLSLPIGEYDELFQLCQARCIEIFLFIYRQIEYHNQVNHHQAVSYITGKIGLDLLVITEVYPVPIGSRGYSTALQYPKSDTI